MEIMLRSEIPITLLLVFLIASQQAYAVVNKAQSQVTKDDDKQNEIKADDRISNTYGVPSDDYGPPLGSLSGPTPVYGPPELVGDHGPTPIYPPPPPDVPPPIYGAPLASYGPPRIIKPHHVPQKQSFPPLPPSKLSFGSLKLHYGPPKQHYGPPYSFAAFRPTKPQFAPPIKFTASVSNQHLAQKPNHGPSIPIVLDTFALPPQKLAVQFASPVGDNYGPPPPPLIVPSGAAVAQYGPPSGDLYRPPPPIPPPGVPAPPTPPDIKYDGWQPIAGLTNQHGSRGSSYGPPLEDHKVLEGSLHLTQATNAVENSNVPSDSYGVPIHNPEAQDLKSSVNSGSNGNKGLPPPPLPEYEPFHNESPPKKAEPEKLLQGQVNLQYEVAKVEPLSIVKTVGFELLPTSSPLTSDLSVGSLPTLKLPVLESASQLQISSGDAHAFQNLANDLAHISVNTLSNNYGPPLAGVSFGKLNSIESGIPLPPPPVLDTYSAPPLSSYSLSGPYPAAEAGRASSFSSFGLHGSSLFKQSLVHHHRPLHGFRPPPPSSLIPPRTREPIKFKELIPNGLLTNLNRYQLPVKSAKNFLPPLSLEQQLPSYTAPVSFNKLPSVGSHSPIAAPNAHYGTPLSFGDFNTPSPVLTYGAPNFGPASSFGSTSSGFGHSLYEGSLSSTYGTPVVNLPLSTGAAHDCGLRQYSFEDTRSPQLASFGAALKTEPLPSGLGGLASLSLESYEQPKVNLKDSYGSPVGISYSTEHTDNVLSSDHSQSSEVANVLSAPPASHPQESFPTASGVKAEALTAAISEQGYSQPKSLATNEVDASQFLNSHEGNEALTLAKGLTASGGDGFEIQGSKGTYRLQIQAADGGLGTENSDGSIRHDQVLSNGLLQDILAAIEQPEQGIQVQGQPEAQPLQHLYSDLARNSDVEGIKGHYITVEQNSQRKEEDLDENLGEDAKNESARKEAVALFFNSQYGDSRKEIRSVEGRKSALNPSEGETKNVSKSKSS